MNIVTKQTIVQRIQYDVQTVYDLNKEVDYIEVSAEEYNELNNLDLFNTLNGITIKIRNSSGHIIPKGIHIKRLFDYHDLGFEELKRYVNTTYSLLKYPKNITYKTLLAKIDKIVEENKAISDYKVI